MRKGKLTLGRIVGMMQGNQDLILRNFVTKSWQEHAKVEVICERLNYMMDTCNAEVYGITYDNEEQAIIIDILYE